MDLISGQPLWPVAAGLPASYPALRSDLECEVVVLGAGITGALVAHRFAADGIDVVVVDRREVGHGSTAASTALVLYELDTHLADLEERIGRRAAQRAYAISAAAAGEIEELARAAPGPVPFERKRSLYLASRRRDVETLRRECAARERIGLPVAFLDRRELRRRTVFDRPAALLSEPAGQVDPYRLTHALLRAAAGAGARIFDRTEVVKLRERRRGLELRTRDGAVVRAQRAVLATGYETPAMLRGRLVRLSSTFALATDPLSPAFDWGENRCLVWEAARPYTYLSSSRDGRLVAGGEDLPFASSHRRGRQLERQTRQLERRLRRLLPAADFTVDWRWAGTFAETRDGLPLIGRSDAFRRGYFALGYGGNGITFGAVAARLLLDLHRRRANPDLALFRLDRPAR